MAEQPFDKINVAQICQRCNMSRKSFYYHFKDKYDLVNWIFDTEFMELIKHENLSAGYTERWVFIEKTADIFNRTIRSTAKPCRSTGKIPSANTSRNIFVRL